MCRRTCSASDEEQAIKNHDLVVTNISCHGYIRQYEDTESSSPDRGVEKVVGRCSSPM